MRAIILSQGSHFSPINVFTYFSRKSYTKAYLKTLNMTTIMLELGKTSNGSPPPIKQVLGRLYTSTYKEYFSGWGYLTSDQVRSLTR